MHIGQILNVVYDEDVGWRPVSGGIKPVHVANGLARALQRRQFNTRRLHRFVVWWKKKHGPVDPARTMEALLQGEDADTFRELARSPRAFDLARRYACGLLGADGALFPSAEHSSFSLTCGAMATRDNNDRGLGEFAAQFLGDATDASSLASMILQGLDASVPRDPVTALVWPLLDTVGTEVKRGERVGKALKQRHNKTILAALTAAASDLATHERAQGNRLRTLQRAVQFTCVATHAHAQALASGGALDKRPPALLAMSGHRRSEIALAGERSLDAVYDRFEGWLVDRLAARIARGDALADGEDLGKVDSADLRKLRPVLARIGAAEKPHGAPTPEVLEARAADFMVARRIEQDAPPAQLLARALVTAHMRENTSGGPRAFLQGLGCRSGLLYPHFQGRAREKRARPSVPVLDMLVRACVPAGKQVRLDEFLTLLWDRFGLMVGGRRGEDWEDAAYLAEFGVPVDAGALEENTEQFVGELAAMGLARRFPDHVTFVGDGYGA